MMICSIIIYFADNENVTKYIDPIMAIISCITLLLLSYPFSKYRAICLVSALEGDFVLCMSPLFCCTFCCHVSQSTFAIQFIILYK